MANKANKSRGFRNLSFIIEDKDTMDFNEYYIRYTKRGQKVVWQHRLIFPAFLIGYLALMKIFNFNSKPVWFGAAALFIVAILYGIRAQARVIENQNNEIRKQSFSLENAHPEPTTLDFDEESVTAAYKGRSQEYPYVDVKKISLTPNAMYVWMDDVVAMQIPDRAYPRVQDKDKLLDFLKEKCVNAEIDDRAKERAEKAANKTKFRDKFDE